MIERPKILLVDDRRENLLALEAVLQDIDVEIFTSESADEALLLVLRHEFAVILLDVEMPGMDGFEMARLIRQRPRTRHTPIIFVTAVDRGESLVIEGYSLGAVDFLIKPFAPDILRWKVQVFADLYRRAQESQELIREQTIRAESVAAADRAGLLGDVSAVLMASADYETDIQRLPELAVRNIADWACLGRSEAPYSELVLQSLAFREQNGQMDSELINARISLESRLVATLCKGVPLIALSVEDLVASGFRLSGTQQQLMATLGFRSALAVPVCRQHEMLGLLLLVRGSAPDFAPLDVMMAEHLSHRINLGITNAHLYQEVQSANRVKDQFLAIVSHELRTPLTAILGWVHILRMKQLEPDRVGNALEIIERNARLQIDLVSDILDISRVATGQLKIEFSDVDLNSVLQRTFESARPLADVKHIDLRYSCETGDAIVRGDETRLQQVLWNLVSNGIKFTPEGGRVDIRLIARPFDLEIRVQDNGRGIRPEMMSRIFDAFVQADTTNTRAHSGLGLGLAIARQLVHLHGGSIRAESRGEGQGATFIVSLPAGERHARAS